MLNFFFSNIKPTFVQEETINEGFDYKNEAFVFINAIFVYSFIAAKRKFRYNHKEVRI